MDKLTPSQFIELLKVLHCLSFDQFAEMMGRNVEDDDHNFDGYLTDKFANLKNDVFRWLCELDSGNQRRVFDYAAKKAEWYALKR